MMAKLEITVRIEPTLSFHCRTSWAAPRPGPTASAMASARPGLSGERVDLAILETCLLKHLARVLPEQGRGTADDRRRLGHLDRRAERLDSPKRRVHRLDHHATCAHLRIREHLGVVIDRTARQAVGLE